MNGDITWPELEAVRSRAVFVELYGFPYVFIHRRDLHGMLVEGIRRLTLDACHLGMRCVGVAKSETGVTLRFHTGEIAQAALTIGADGVHSIVRESLFAVA